MDIEEGRGNLSKSDRDSILMPKPGLSAPFVPSSFAQSEPETIIRRQKPRPPNGLKHVDIPSRFQGTDTEWEFAGWGSFSYLNPSPEDLEEIKYEVETEKKAEIVGILRGSSLSGNMVFWARNGSSILKSNWDLRPKDALHTVRAIFNGICVGFLGVTGFETTPTYVEVIRRDAYPSVLTIALTTTLLLNGPMMLCVYVVLPTEVILQGTNILSILASSVAGEWLRILVVIDAVLVLSGGIIDGICSANALLDRLAKDNVFPKWLLRTLPLTGAQYIAVTICLALDILLYACSAFNLVTLSAVFTITFLVTLMTFVISNLMLKFSCDELPRKPRVPFLAVILTLAAVIVLLIGNIALSPEDLALFVAYYAVIAAVLLLFKTKLFFMRLGLWISCQCNLQNYAFFRRLQNKFISFIKKTARHPVIVWVGHDDIHALVKAILYIRKNELTNNIIFAHAHVHNDSILEELASNIKILDEAFPSITIDSLIVKGEFGPMV
ncbi:hypothetical protein Clacol_007483 [Clathrus columnatus]|uniref:Uncharacterized protein n=1 Tax=Clathrus columnatus TaxID=1419009 RepID=A0AAV5AF22_9AGAM|nr:hypothetical protein Clacol_007483 [Clathrus columnatus]